MLDKLIALLERITKKLPSMVYALGVVGILCVLAIARILKLQGWKNILEGSGAVLVLMFALFVFTRMVDKKDKWMRSAATLFGLLIYLVLFGIVILFAVSWYRSGPAKPGFSGGGIDTGRTVVVTPPPPKVVDKVSYVVSGHVYDENSHPLDGVRLTVDGKARAVVTNGDGFFEFVFDHRPQGGRVTISYVKSGFRAWVQTYDEVPKTDIATYLSKDTTSL